MNTSGVLKTVNGAISSSTATGALQVTGGAGITGDIYVGSTANIAGALNVTGAQTFTGATTMNGVAQFNGNVAIANTKTFAVGTGATTLGGTLGVTGVTTLNNTVSITGASTFTVGTGATALGGSLTVTGVTTLNGLVYAPTPAIGDATTRVATVGYVQDAMLNTNNGWTADGNTGMSTYTINTSTTVRDQMSAFETNAGSDYTRVGTWASASALTSFTDKFLGTNDANALVFRVYKNRAGRMDYDLNMGQVSFGYGAASNTWLNTTMTTNGDPLYNYKGTKNTAIGYEALKSTNIGKDNVALGYMALKNNQSYNGMVAIGFESMSNFTSAYNTLSGVNSSWLAADQLTYARSLDGFNTAVGYQSLKGSTTITSNTGLYNTAIGYQSIFVNTSGASNTALGYQTLKTNTTGGQNVAIGQSALSLNNLSNYNTAVGYEALRNAETAGTNGNGGFNTAIGYLAGTYSTPLTTGYNNTFLGTYTYSTVNTVANSTAIGYLAFVNANNMIQLGNTSVSLVNTSGVLKTTNGTAATTTATGALQVTGGAGITGAIYYGGTLNAASDRRIKKDITNTSYGLKEILQLRPVDYKLISNNENEIGFIAQELKQVLPTVVNGIEGDLEKGELLSVKYQNLIPVLAKSIQELNALNTKTQTDLNTKLSYSTPSQLTLGNANVKEVITTANVTVGESLSVKHLKGNSAAPTIAASAGSGTNATVKITGTDMSGVIEVTTGDSTTANEVLASIQYSTAYSSAPVVIITPGNAATASLMGTSTVFVGNNTNTNFTLNTNTTPLATNTTFKWYYQVIQ